MQGAGQPGSQRRAGGDAVVAEQMEVAPGQPQMVAPEQLAQWLGSSQVQRRHWWAVGGEVEQAVQGPAAGVQAGWPPPGTSFAFWGRTQ